MAKARKTLQKKRNPQDSTLRNVRAIKKRVNAHDAKIIRCWDLVRLLEARVTALESRSPIEKLPA